MKSSLNPFPTKNLLLSMLLAAVLIITACGGGGGSSNDSGDDGGGIIGDVEALALPDRIQLSNAEESLNHATAGNRTSRVYSDSGTDYTGTAKQIWVEDTNALEMINTVLQVCSETGYANFVNAGPYKALVRDGAQSQESQSGSSTTSTATETLMEIIVNVTRASNDDPMYIKIWLFVNGPNDSPMLVRGYFTVEEGVSDIYPYGIMDAHFKGNMVDNSGVIGEEVMQMSLSVDAQNGDVIIENLKDEGMEGMWESHSKVRVVTNEDISEGNAYFSLRETENDGEGNMILPDDPTIMQICFNQDYFKATETGQDPLYFDKSQFRHRVHRYKLFDAATGEEITRNSGLPIEWETDGVRQNGYIGYYGMWTNNGSGQLADGDTVYDLDGEAYTLLYSRGKLTKHTASSMLLSELTDVELSKWTNGQDDIVAWNGTQFQKIGYRDNTNGQIVYYEEGVDDAYHQTVTFNDWEGAWCEALKAYLRLGSLFAGDNEPSDGSTVFFHEERTVSAAEATDLTLYTWSFTLDNPITQSVVDSVMEDQNNYWSNQAESTFHFSAADMMLYDASDTYEVVIPSDVTIPDNNNLQGGYHIGPLTTTQYNENNWWQANEADVYYSWNTGEDAWNHYITLVSGAGQAMAFDAPLSFVYTHSTANDANGDATYDGDSFRLEYDGFSVNMPWFFNEDSGEWEPQINIADGTVMGPSGTEYVIKGIEEALIMSQVDDPSGITFSNETQVGAPTLEYDATKTALVGNVPTNVELKVIKGELIE